MTTVRLVYWYFSEKGSCKVEHKYQGPPRENSDWSLPIL